MSMRERKELLGLDLMRAVAALCVVLVHSTLLFGQNLAPGAHLAVDFFFALSGYVIAHAYDDQHMGVRVFMLRRAIRLYPLYAVGLSLGLLQALALWGLGRTSMTGSDIALSGLLNAVYLPSPFGAESDALFPLNGPSWSLFFELLINWLYATAIYRRSAFMGAVVLLGGAVLLAAVARHGSADLGWQWTEMHVGLAKVMCSFTLGVMLRRCVTPCPWVLRGPALGCALAILMLVMLFPVPERLRAWVDAVFIFGISPLLVWVGASAVLGDRMGRWAKTLGGASYGLYITHLPLVFAAGFVGHKVGVPAWVLGSGFVLAVLGWAVWLERVWDRPARKWLSRKLVSG